MICTRTAARAGWIAIAATLLAAPGTSVAAASSEERVRVHGIAHVDPAHDVVSFDDAGERRRAPRMADPDVVRVAARHGDHNLWMRFRLRNLMPVSVAADRATRNWSGRIVTRVRQFRLYGFVHPQDEGVPLIEFSKGPRDCPRLDVFFRYRRDVVAIRVPRSCLGEPRWVRVGMVFQRQPSLPSGENRPTLLDDLLSPQLHGRFGLGTLSRRIYHESRL